jgi:hypothetical protein
VHEFHVLLFKKISEKARRGSGVRRHDAALVGGRRGGLVGKPSTQSACVLSFVSIREYGLGRVHTTEGTFAPGERVRRVRETSERTPVFGVRQSSGALHGGQGGREVWKRERARETFSTGELTNLPATIPPTMQSARGLAHSKNWRPLGSAKRLSAFNFHPTQVV